ncbi:hypothetical protein [Leptospira barantonii]|uniref:Uncharacterized protein n=1 Tax=Leptospira barantonii TaxID=2023184 RepID=A0ABX4NQG2_9LEPT|nr:hypothetical protein [Leptospira barantonii]PJZ59075.1 hypothetical protein CH367_03350 [Leptospira barantonii]
MKLLQIWQSVATELQIEIEVPNSFSLPNGEKINVEFIVKNFGAPNGMLIVSDYSSIQPFTEKILNAGYGYSTLDEPLDKEECSKENMKEILNDWGWCGPDNLKPNWIKPETRKT